MPFLRSLQVDSSLELRSSKTLVGAGEATCDVVISGDNVLDLHALLNLSAEKTSAKLVPFSNAGVCYVNEVLVPRDGALVVHGDRVAFGDPHNVFLFELTPHPHVTTLQQSIVTENSMKDQTIDTSNRFRQALDALRGDRANSTVSANVAASIQSNLQSRNRSSSPSSTDPSVKSKGELSKLQLTMSSSPSSTDPSLKSKGELSKFLVEASTDSLLSDYVDRKLNQRQSRQHSITSSNYSESNRRSRLSSDARQSREERKLAEVEKLRLSQRIREVNDVLNGDIDFKESYLSLPSKSSRSRKPRSTVNNNDSTNFKDDESVKSDEENEDEDEELPTMMEKVSNLPASLSASIQTEHSDQECHSPQNREEAGDQSELLDVSLESEPISDPTQTDQLDDQSSKPPKLHGFVLKAKELGLTDLTRSYSRPIKTERQQAAKTILHQKLVDQVIRRKKDEILNKDFELRVYIVNAEHDSFKTLVQHSEYYVEVTFSCAGEILLL
ncbi:hypothetical protein PHMEG_00023848 [Phytophthora megakarya]|uniref:FHA domain-containing protein n=1 Tax=Phytophthora megakarya TaxID=4795 RepID=A0A225VF47_9STRA|nr:hypothetical protein PHMEG_00023848 [Phytophthora megakarya]